MRYITRLAMFAALLCGSAYGKTGNVTVQETTGVLAYPTNFVAANGIATTSMVSGVSNAIVQTASNTASIAVLETGTVTKVQFESHAAQNAVDLNTLTTGKLDLATFQSYTNSEVESPYTAWANVTNKPAIASTPTNSASVVWTAIDTQNEVVVYSASVTGQTPYAEYQSLSNRVMGVSTSLFAGYGTTGAVRSISLSDAGKFLQADGNWGIPNVSGTVSLAYLQVTGDPGTSTGLVTWAGTNRVLVHSNLNSLSWSVSGHTGSVNTIAGFDASGKPATYLPSAITVTAIATNATLLTYLGTNITNSALGSGLTYDGTNLNVEAVVDTNAWQHGDSVTNAVDALARDTANYASNAASGWPVNSNGLLFASNTAVFASNTAVWSSNAVSGWLADSSTVVRAAQTNGWYVGTQIVNIASSTNTVGYFSMATNGADYTLTAGTNTSGLGGGSEPLWTAASNGVLYAAAGASGTNTTGTVFVNGQATSVGTNRPWTTNGYLTASSNVNAGNVTGNLNQATVPYVQITSAPWLTSSGPFNGASVTGTIPVTVNGPWLTSASPLYASNMTGALSPSLVTISTNSITNWPALSTLLTISNSPALNAGQVLVSTNGIALSVAIGTNDVDNYLASTNPSAAGRLTITGNSNTQQLVIVNNATQTANPQEWRGSDGSTVLAYVDPTGGIRMAGCDVAGNLMATNATLSGNLNLNAGNITNLLKIIGGGATNSVLKLQGTSANGFSGTNAVEILVGNNGATRALQINNGGSIGINTTPPTGTADLVLSGTQAHGLCLVDTTWFLMDTRNNTVDFNVYSRPLIFTTDVHLEKMRMTTAGWFGFNITNPAALLDVGGSLIVRTNLTLTGGSLVVTGAVTATAQATVSNLVLSTPRWADSAMVFSWETGGLNAPDLMTLQAPYNAIWALGFDVNDRLTFMTQFNHNLAPSNSSLYIEPHLHVLPIDSDVIDSTHNLVQLRLTYAGASISGTLMSPPITNTMEFTISTNTHTLVEAGHLTNSVWYPGISGKIWGVIERITATSNGYAGAVSIDGDFHYPVDRLGSASDSAP